MYLLSLGTCLSVFGHSQKSDLQTGLLLQKGGQKMEGSCCACMAQAGNFSQHGQPNVLRDIMSVAITAVCKAIC